MHPYIWWLMGITLAGYAITGSRLWIGAMAVAALFHAAGRSLAP